MKYIVLSLFLSSAALPAFSHELWLEPEKWQVPVGTEIRAHIRNGEKLKGLDLAWFENRIDRLERHDGGGVTAITGRMGDVPAVITPAAEGLNVLVYQSPPSTLKYDSWEKFEGFARHKDHAWAVATHEARGWSREDVTEIYTRHAKALVRGGTEQTAFVDRVTAMETEFVALNDPHEPNLAAMQVQLYYQGRPRAGAQIEVFERDGAGDVAVFLLKTDAEGRAAVPVDAGHVYLLDAVVLREAKPEAGVMWESLWAALTFAIPER